MIKAADILRPIHAQGVVHGDVKPDNILINKQPEIGSGSILSEKEGY